MPSNSPLQKGSKCPLYYCTCGTSSHCVSLTTPGADSTNDEVRGRRLGPRWDRRPSHPQNDRPAVVVESCSPSKTPDHWSAQQPEFGTSHDNSRVHPSPRLDVVVRMPRNTRSVQERPLKGVPGAFTPVAANKRSSIPLLIGVAGVLAALVALLGLTWLTRAKHAESRVFESQTAPVVSIPASTASGPAMSEPAPNNASTSSSPPDRNNRGESTNLISQHGTVPNEHHPTAGVATINTNAPGDARHRFGANPKTATNANGLVDLANDYLRRDGVPRGCAKAMSLLNKAANAESVRARNRLASMFAVGSCVQRNPMEAYRWMSAALELDPHNQWAKQNRELMLRQMTVEERNRLRSAE